MGIGIEGTAVTCEFAGETRIESQHNNVYTRCDVRDEDVPALIAQLQERQEYLEAVTNGKS